MSIPGFSTAPTNVVSGLAYGGALGTALISTKVASEAPREWEVGSLVRRESIQNSSAASAIASAMEASAIPAFSPGLREGEGEGEEEEEDGSGMVDNEVVAGVDNDNSDDAAVVVVVDQERLVAGDGTNNDGAVVTVTDEEGLVVGGDIDVELVLELEPAKTSEFDVKVMPVPLSQQVVLLLPQQNVMASLPVQGVTSALPLSS